MKISIRIWFLLMGCALALPGRLSAQDEQGVPAPPPPDQSTDQPASGQGPYPGPEQEQAPAPGQDQDASFQTFYDELSSQGTWINSSDYGDVWQPNVDDPNWAPYTDGDWDYSNYGWTWDSNEPWGWATYHYGRWVNIKHHGWCWVPGYTWAPAWVSWRYGNGYCGWAPLPPDSFYGIDYFDGQTDFSMGFHIGGDCDFFFGIGPGCYNFLPVTCLGYRNYHGCYASKSDNFAIINHTTNVTNIVVSHNGSPGGPAFGHVTVGGPSLEQVNAVAETPVPKVSLAASSRPGGGEVSGHTLALYAPTVDPGTRTTSRPAHVAGTIGPAKINRGTDVTDPLAVNAKLSPTPPTEAQVERAHQAQAQVPAGAKVVTERTAIQPVINGPLTSLQTLPGTGRGTAANVGTSVSSPQPEGTRQQGGPVVYPQGQVYQPAPGYTSENHSASPSESEEHPTQSSTPPTYTRSYSTTSSAGSSEQGGGSSQGYHHSTTPSGTVYHSTQSSSSPGNTRSYSSSSNSGSSQQGGGSGGGGYRGGNGSQQGH